ncbi:MAG: PilC/PilY family type IV pilus protein [Desulfuromonadales bacterium]|nr:PilC/PilY family type IV pilus protein [Desulfuromonadales bacterium]
MQTRSMLVLLAGVLATLGAIPANCFAGPDDYIGDSNIYVGSSDQRARPNVLFILDTSLASLNPAGSGTYATPFTCTGTATDQTATCSKDAAKAYTPDATPPFNPEEIYQFSVNGTWTPLRNATPYLLSNAAGCVGSRTYTVSDGTSVTEYKNLQVYLAKYGTYTGIGDAWFPSLTNAACDSTSGRGGTYATGDYLNFIFRNVVTGTGTTTAAKVVHGIAGGKYAVFTALREHVVPAAGSYVNGNNLTACNITSSGYNGQCSEPYTGRNDTLYWSKGATSYASRTDAAIASLPNWSTGTTYVGPPPPAADYETQREIFYEALERIITRQRVNINFGVMVYNPNIQGGIIIDHPTDTTSTSHVQDLRLEANLNKFLFLLPKGENSGVVANKANPDSYDIASGEGPRTIKAGPQRPLAEVLFDAGHYFMADYPGTSEYINESRTIDTAAAIYPNVDNCDYNHIIMITNGLPNAETTASVGYLSIGDQGDYDGDFAADPTLERSYGQGTHFLDDIAGYLHDTKGVTIYTILAFQGYDSLLDDTAVDGGSSHLYLAGSAGDLANAFDDIFNNIVAEKDSAFVAPVVPASSTNRTISSNRVYLGLFKPQIKAAWHGNVKKYQVKFGSVDTLADASGNDATDVNGDFIAAVKSYWGSATVTSLGERIFSADPENPYRLVSEGDGGIVDAGGIGGSLKARPNLYSGETYWSRSLFTYLSGTKTPLRTNSTTYIAPVNFGLLSTETDERTRLVDWLYGFDAYNDSNRYGARDWLMGDVLHSRPLVFNYSNYADADENYCSESPRAGGAYNSSVIFVGGNDGMMHAFRDCDGKELWGFVPPLLLNRLKSLPDISHNIFVDGAPTLYVHDTLNDGVINSSQDDKVILLFGLRRGGGNNTLDDDGDLSTQVPRGAYYALDVTNPANPTMLWEITSNTSGYEELGESWSQPRLGMLKDSSGVSWLVAFVGAGYDQNEDLRWGNTQTFPDDTTHTKDTTLLSNDSGTQTSAGTSGPYNPRGRGIFAIKVAQMETYTLDTVNALGDPVSYPNQRKPNLTGTGGLLWKFTYGTGTSTAAAGQSNQMTYSFPSDLTVLDLNGDGLVDRIYTGDTGGRMWRFDDNGNPYTYDLDGGNLWTGNIIFSSNPGYDGDFNDTTGAYSVTSETSNGRKIFYKPAVTIMDGNPVLYFGTGDREHPLNFSVADRVYSLTDRGQNYSTSDQLPAATNPDDTRTDNVNESHLIDLTDNDLQNGTSAVALQVINALETATNFGWYIKLENTGEKSLSAPVVFGGQAYYTTYSPLLVIDDPCEVGNLGTSRLYHLDYQTGEAVFNHASDSGQTANTENIRASKDGAILLKADRIKQLGEGIPSGIVTLIDASGKVTLMISASNRVGTYAAPDTRLITPVYYMQWAPK